MRARGFTWLIVAGFLGSAAYIDVAFADDDDVVGVMDRLRPDYDAKGLPLGSFRLRPSLDLGVWTDDNVFRTETGDESDVFYTIAPSLDLRSEWSEDRLEFTAGLVRYQYSQHNSESRTDWNVGANGELDILRGTTVEGSTNYAVLHEPRYSPDEPGGAARPTQYGQYHADAVAKYQPARIGLAVGGSVDRFDYNATPLVGGGEFDNHDRDHDQYEAYAKVSYEASPGYGVFLRGAYDAHRFDELIDRNGFDRDSHAEHVDAGVDFFATHLLQGEFFVGYVSESFEQPFKNIGTLDYSAALHWYATPLMTFHLTASRAFDDTTLAGASVSDDQIFGAAMDYELLRDLILQTHVDFTDSKFEGIARDDKLLEVAFNAKYLINRYMSAQAGYVYSRRNSSVAGQDFTDNSFMAGLHFQL